MKKNILLILLIFTYILTGCQLNNTPTSKVEERLSQYQMLDKNISTSYTQITTDNNIDSNFQKDYQELIKKQYKNLSYEIKDEKIDGDTATVTAQIEVLDFKKAFEKYDQADYSTKEYHQKILASLQDVKDKITYTIDFEVTKDKKGNWHLTPLDSNETKKLIGMV